MMDIEEYQSALSFAPLVSMGYWKKCVDRYIQSLEQAGDTDILPLCKIATNDTESLIHMLVDKKNFEDAKLIRLMNLGGVYNKNESLVNQLAQVEVPEEEIKTTDEVFQSFRNFQPDESDILAQITSQ